MGILDKVKSTAKQAINSEPVQLTKKILTQPSMVQGAVRAIAPMESALAGLFSSPVQASEQPIVQQQSAQAVTVPSQNQGFMGGLLGGIGGAISGFFGNQNEYNEQGMLTKKGSGVLGFAQANPALFTGLTTMAIGAGSGLQGLESASLGGQVAGGVQSELQRQLEQQQKLQASMAPVQVTDTTKQLENEVNLLGLKRPQDRQAYVQKRLAGERPSYSGGFFGIGQGVY